MMKNARKQIINIYQLLMDSKVTFDDTKRAAYTPLCLNLVFPKTAHKVETLLRLIRYVARLQTDFFYLMLVLPTTTSFVLVTSDWLKKQGEWFWEWKGRSRSISFDVYSKLYLNGRGFLSGALYHTRIALEGLHNPSREATSIWKINFQ